MRIKDLDIYISDGNYSSKYPRSDEFVENGIPFIRANNLINGDISDDDMYFITEEKHSILLKGHVKSGDVLITTRGNIGQVAIVPERHNDSNINAQLVLLRTNPDRIYNRYLLWALQSYHAQKQILELQTGSTLKQLPVGRLEQIKIKLFELSVQRKIAANLDKVTHTIDLCNNILEKLDLLVKSRFVELFGNFVLEKERWKKCCVGDVAGTVDPQPSHRTPPIDVDGIPYIGIAECNYQSRKIDFESARKVGKKVLEEHIARYELHNGDFIIGKIGTIGKPFFIPSERFYTLSANTVLIQPNSEMIAPQFLFSIFQSEYMDRIIDAEKKSTSQPAFGIQKVRAIEIPLPPIDLQNQFAAFVEQTDKSKSAVKQVLEKAETLKKALMQEYFG